MEGARVRPPEASEHHAVEEKRRWEEALLTRHGDLEEVTGMRLLDAVSGPPDPGEDF
jgi:hypothetical protein